MSADVAMVRIAGRDLTAPLPDGLSPTDPGDDGPALLALDHDDPFAPVVTAVVTPAVGLDASLDALRDEIPGLALVDVEVDGAGAMITLLQPGVGTDVVTVQRLIERDDTAVTVSYSCPVEVAADRLCVLSRLAREVRW